MTTLLLLLLLIVLLALLLSALPTTTLLLLLLLILLLALLLIVLPEILPQSSAEGESAPSPDSPEEALPDSSPGVFMTEEEYKSHIELYKFGLEYAFKAITIFFALVGGVLTFGLGSDGASDISRNPVKSALLITAFLVTIAMTLGFGTTMYLWRRLSRQVNKRNVKKGTVRDVNKVRWYEFVIRLYSPSLTLMLGITTFLFLIFSFLLGDIMVHSGIRFWPPCWP
jgi:hypothetical protein